MKIRETIVVEGRDDTAAIHRAVEALTIETHGFGIKKATWDLIKKADETTGIIIFTDPDHSGEEIRKKLAEQFPQGKHAYVPKEEAMKLGNIGVENASPHSIREALEKAKCTTNERREEFTIEDMSRYGLSGNPDSAAKRHKLGKALGIGYGNSKSFLKKLNQFGITRTEFIKYLQGENINETLRTIDHKSD